MHNQSSSPSVGKVIMWVVLGLVGLMIFFWSIGWIGTPLQVTSSENVRKQFAFAYQYDESLNAASLQFCTARDARDRAEAGEAKNQRESQVIALEQNYARIAAEYNAKLRDAFEAKYVAPADVPRQAPSLDDKVSKNCSSKK